MDESPFAYRKISDILPVIGETVEVEKILKPIYNFKAWRNHKPLYSKVEEFQNFIVKSLSKKEAVVTGKIAYNYQWGNGMFLDKKNTEI